MSQLKNFALKWNMDEEKVNSIYHLIQSYNGKYGKAQRALKQFGIKLSVRQIRYFYRKVRLTERYGGKDKIGQDNFSKLVNKQS